MLLLVRRRGARTLLDALQTFCADVRGKRDACFQATTDMDYDQQTRGISRLSFFFTYSGWIRLCRRQRKARERYVPPRPILFMCLGLSANIIALKFSLLFLLLQTRCESGGASGLCGRGHAGATGPHRRGAAPAVGGGALDG